MFNMEKGNQNNMSALKTGEIPLVSAKKIDNGYKDFVLHNGKKLFPANCITLNNDGDGGAGIAYYQPAQMALDSHVTCMESKSAINKFAQIFISNCITKQREQYGHGYSINNKRLRVFKIMLPVNIDGNPDYAYMEAYMRLQEQKQLKRYLGYLEGKTIKNEC